jgi:Maltokinase N-terminal cap domain
VPYGASAVGTGALLHQATVTPTKLDALTAWLPSRSWFDGADVSTLTQVGAYRFDDPVGEVGVETLLVRTADGRLLQVPLSYRAAPLAGAEDALVTTMERSTTGTVSGSRAGRAGAGLRAGRLRRPVLGRDARRERVRQL